jgi:hypothetical protein
MTRSIMLDTSQFTTPRCQDLKTTHLFTSKYDGWRIFCAKDRIHPFRRIPVDQTLKVTGNRDTQTVGGTKGFSLKPETAKYYLSADHRSMAMRQLRESY